MRIQDLDERILALEPFQSFAVSAPAGSGKNRTINAKSIEAFKCCRKSRRDSVYDFCQ